MHNQQEGALFKIEGQNISEFHTIEKLCKKVGSGYSIIFQLTVWVSKLDFRDLKLKIDEEYLI